MVVISFYVMYCTKEEERDSSSTDSDNEEGGGKRVDFEGIKRAVTMMGPEPAINAEPELARAKTQIGLER